MERIIKVLLILFSFTCVFYFCVKDSLTNQEDETVVVPRVVWKKGEVTTLPDEVDSIRITITYNTTTLIKTFPFSDDTGTFESLPTGATIDILIEGLDANGIVVYRGIKESILLTGDWVEVVIEAHEVTPIAPDSLKATVISYKTIQLTWQDKSSNEIKFIIERKTGIGSFDSITNVVQNQESYTDTGLTALTTYCYRIYSQNGAGNSLQYSTSEEVTTPDTGTNTKPYFIDATINALKDDTLNVNERYVKYVHAQDDDGDIITYSASQQLTVVVDSIIWTPTIGDTGNNFLWVKADDGKGLYDSIGWKLVVVDTIIQVDSSLVAYYPFNGNANDKSGNENHGTEYGGVSLTSDRFGNANSAYSFDGANDYMIFPTSGYSDINTYTVSLWIKLSSEPISNVYIWEGTVLSSPSLEYWDSTNFAYWVGDNKNVNTGYLSIEKWYYIVATYNKISSIQRLYVNNVLKGENNVNVYDTLGSNLYLCSRQGNSGFFNGNIDDIRIYNRSLNSAEIDSLYHINGWPINQNPQFTHDSTEMTDSAIVGSEYKDTVHAFDPDGDQLTFSFLDSVAGMFLSDSIIIWTPTLYDIGSNIVSVMASDGKGGHDTLNWNIFVKDTTEINLDSGLVAYYPFTGNANDSSGNENHATVIIATLKTDRFGNPNAAYQYNGAGDYISIPTLKPIQNIPINQFSFEAWIKSVSGDSITPQNLFEVHTQATSGNKEVFFEANMPAPMRFGITDTSSGDHQISSLPLSLNAWYQIVGTYNGSTQKIYINGALHDSLAWSSYFTITTGALLGKDIEGGQFFNGLIDDIRIYNRALNYAEIDSLYHLGGWIGNPPAGMVPIP